MRAIDFAKNDLEVRALLVDGESLLYIWIQDEEGNKQRVKFTGKMAEQVAESMYRELQKLL